MAIQRARLLCEIEGTNEAELLRLYELAELDEQRAEIEATIGSYYIRQQDFSVGASWLERAQQTAPNASSAGANLLAAARAREKAKQLSKAERLYTRLGKKYQDYAAQADIGLAELLLSDGKARSARRFFERAVRRASTADLSALAQFGVATCLERMGELDEALSEMDSVDLPMAILDERRDGIRAHQISEIGGM
jgi:tetratricopeptide (TPR) repeat protein